MLHFGIWTWAGVQALAVTAALAALELAPPAHGTILLVSVTGMAPGAILDNAMRAGALPVRAGPWPSSIVVYGDRDRIIAATLSSGILTLAGGGLCGERL